MSNSEDGKNYRTSELKEDMDSLSGDLSYLKGEIRSVNSDVRSIKVLLIGTESDTPDGLVYITSKNTDFRRNSTKVLWFMFTLIAALIINELFGLFK